MLRINKSQAELLREKNLGKFIHPTTGHHKNWYVVENEKVLAALGMPIPKRKKFYY